MMHNKQNSDEQFVQAGEYTVGSTIIFSEGDSRLTGEIILVNEPQATARGHHLPESYSVDCGDGFPHIVLSSQVVKHPRNDTKVKTSSPERIARGYKFREDLIKQCKQIALDDNKKLYEVMEEALEEYIERRHAN